MHQPWIVCLCRAAGGAATALVAATSSLLGQVPSKIPSDTEAQIFNLIKRVTALEEQVASLKGGSATLRVQAPFIVTDAGGHPILQVVGKESPLGQDGVVIAHDVGSDIAGVLIYSESGEPAVALAQYTGKGGGLALSDDKGGGRAELTGDGRLALGDESGQDFVVLAEDISKEEAIIRIGGDEEGFVVTVGDEKGAASLGLDADGASGLSLTDEQNRPRVMATGEGTLEIAAQSGKDVLVVAEDVSGDSAEVTIGKGTHGGYRIAVGTSASSVVMGTNGQTAGFGAYVGGQPRASLTSVGGLGIVNLTNSAGAVVANLQATDGGNGLLQLGNASGQTTVDAGTTGEGVGLVRAYPVGSPGAGLIGMPGTFLLGRR